MAKVIVHIDLNYFFVRCEEIKNPSLEGKPVAIGHVGRGGIVSTCSYKAREFGVRSGMPMFQALKLCKDLIVINGDYDFYSVLSREFMLFVKEYTNKIEVASIDECYADFSDVLKGNNFVIDFFKQFQKELFKRTKLYCSIGISTNKFLAKMGSDYKKPNGITILRQRDFKEKIYPLKIEDMYGIGKKSAPRLRSIGINTIGDLALAIKERKEEVIAIAGKFFETLNEWVNGRGEDEIYNVDEIESKSIGNSHTLSHDTNNYEEIKEALKNLAKEVSSRAIKENKFGKTVQITLKDTNFISQNKSITFSKPINDVNNIYYYCVKLLDKHYDGRDIRLVGVTLQNLVDVKDIVYQMTFFDYEQAEEESSTKLLINELNRKLSKPMLKRASEVEDENK